MGKSTLAQALSHKYPTIDTDLWIEQKSQKPRRVLLQEEGIEAFRQYEKKALEELIKQPPSIIACGGGIIFVEKIADFFSGHEVLHIRRPLEEMQKRIFCPPLPFFIDPDHLEDSFLSEWTRRIALYESYQTAELHLR